MKRILIIMLCLCPLSACDQVKDKVIEKAEKLMPESTGMQNIKSGELFEAVVKHDTKKIYSMVGQNVRNELEKNPQALKSTFEVLPNYVAENPEIVQVIKAIEMPIGKPITKIGYKYNYPDQSYVFSVVYRGHDGGTEIVGLWVRAIS